MLHAFPSAAPSSYEPTEALLLPSPRELPGLWAVNCLPWAPGRCKAILTTCFSVGGLKMELATPQVCTPEEYPCVLFLRALRVHLCLEPMLCNKRCTPTAPSPCNEKPAYGNKE